MVKELALLLFSLKKKKKSKFEHQDFLPNRKCVLTSLDSGMRHFMPHPLEILGTSPHSPKGSITALSSCRQCMPITP